MNDAGRLYRDCLQALDDVTATLTPDELRRTVPATPEWDVRTVVAHLAGVSSDNVSGRLDGAPSPAWTARHVTERADATLPDLIAELRSREDTMAGLADQAPVPAMVWDIAVHLTDLYEALGRGMADAHLWEPVLDQAAERRIPGLPVADVDPYELFRALFSRRSRAQIRDMGLGDHVDAICIFGPRDDDQPRPT